MPPNRTQIRKNRDTTSHQDGHQVDNSAPQKAPSERSRLPFWSAVVLTGIITVASFILSFVALWDLFTQVGQPKKISWLFAILLDGAILQATISVVWLADAPGEKGRSDRRFFWFVLIFSATASIFGNGMHAYTNHAPGFDPRLAAIIATIPPIALLLASHGLTILARRSQPNRAPAEAFSAEQMVSAVVSVTPPSTEMAEDAITEEIRAALPEPIDSPAEEPSELEIKKFDSLEARIEYALEQNALGVDLHEIASVVDRSESTIYRWIGDAKESRPLVPQGRQLANVG